MRKENEFYSDLNSNVFTENITFKRTIKPFYHVKLTKLPE